MSNVSLVKEMVIIICLCDLSSAGPRQDRAWVKMNVGEEHQHRLNLCTLIKT